MVETTSPAQESTAMPSAAQFGGLGARPLGCRGEKGFWRRAESSEGAAL